MPADKDKEMILVQFCPCGCTSHMTREDLIAAGAGKQLEKIEADIKLDAPMLPSKKCPQCEEDARMRDERIARFLDDWLLDDWPAINLGED
jgi:hypothetical protein